MRWGRRLLLSACALVGLSLPSFAYSVLGHQAIIDAVWQSDLAPMLRQRFPQITPEDLKQAHAYAYGGAIIQDMGYYPYGNKFFSDLTHYVRSGDFILALLRDAQTANEYAFALGAVAHYAADNEGHRLGVNPSVPLLYPRLEHKFGPYITYEEDPLAHLKTEFGFDVLEVAQGRFTPNAYHDFIGFEVAVPLLERAFRETYGLELSSVLLDEKRAVGSYRHDVSSIIPKATRVAWQLKKDDIRKDAPGITRRRFLYNISRAGYEKEWGNEYRRPSFGIKVLAFVFRIIPKIGPLRALSFHMPTPETERLFEASFNASVNLYRQELAGVRRGDLRLPNDNFDTGSAIGPGKYQLEDKTYAALLEELAEQNFSGMSGELRANLLRFYSDPAAPDADKRNRKQWAKVEKSLERLRDTPATPVAEGEDAAPSH